MASKQLKKAIDKHRAGKEEPQKHRCRVCGKETINCIRLEDNRGDVIYSVCSVCAVTSDHPEAKQARADRSRV